MSTVTESMQGLSEYLTTILSNENVKEALGQERVAEISQHLTNVDEALANPAILTDFPKTVVNSFDDWDERIKGVVEFIRADTSMTTFNIQSLTAKELQDVRSKLAATAPVQPSPRNRGDGKVDMDDKHYTKDMEKYEKLRAKQDDLNVLFILEYGLPFDIPGKDNDEKLENVFEKVAGDAGKIASAIMDLSNLTPETMRPF
jgi:hypothetical protein